MKKFNPLTFLAALGAGGISIAPFVYFQYIMPHGKGLTTYSEMMNNATTGAGHAGGMAMAAVMVIFAVIHFGLTGKLVADLIAWRRTDDYKAYSKDPQRNTKIMASFTNFAMTFNVLIGAVRFFVPAMQNNFQSLMLPALVAWGILWLWLMSTEIKILKTAFERDFNISEISFGWLMQPFALGMISVSGFGIAAMAQSENVAHTAAFLSLISVTMGVFLFMVKLISVFQSHFVSRSMPERHFLPSFLIVVPIVTIYALSFFRLGHYLEHQFAADLSIYYTIMVAVPFAFQTWYLGFGLTMLKSYFKKDFFKKEYYVSLWAFICPFVGYAVLGSFVYKYFLPVPLIQVLIFSSGILAILFYVFTALRYYRFSHPAKVEAVAR
ncbi:MAG: selenoprotein TsoY [Bacteroidota bacterium]